MIDPVLALASSVQSNKGAYAVLAGSGVSRAAGVPTGYEVMLDLIRRLARAKGVDCGPDPEAWYRTTFGGSPTYPTLLDSLAVSEADRSRLLRGYFEPTEEERAKGLKLPTKAHRAVASMIAQGFIRVVVTTNFDRLFEQALVDRGIVPTVISTPDQIEGMQPLPHVQQLLIKVHGDYLDTRMKNTAEELATFDPRMGALLSRVFGEFGLIVCGWSAEYDTALRRAVERCPSRSFGFYWTARGDLTPITANLIARRGARVIPIEDADDFFHDLHEKVVALDQGGKASPLSIEVAVTRLKQYVPEDRFRIELGDLIRGEIRRVIAALSDERFPVDEEPPTREKVTERIEEYERVVEPLVHLLAAGCYWGEARHLPLWRDAITGIANRPQGLCPWPDYPAVLLCYAAGVGAVAAERYETLVSLMTRCMFEGGRGETRPAIEVAHAGAIPGVWLELLPGMRDKREEARLSLHLHDILQRPLDAVVTDSRAYDRAFDRFECLCSLIYYDHQLRRGGSSRTPVGRFAWHDVEDPTGVISRFEREVEEQRADWSLVSCGLFDRDFTKVKRALAELRRQIVEAGVGWAAGEAT